MKILIVSEFGETLDLAMKMQDAGHTIEMWINEKMDQDIGDGIVPKVKSWQASAKKADLIIAEDVGLGAMWDRLRKFGKVIIGGSAFTDRLENDRIFGIDTMRAVGIKTPEHVKFTNFQKAISYVKRNKKRYVFKPFGQLPRTFTHVADDWIDMAETLEQYNDFWKEKAEFMLQEYVEGIEMAISAFWNGAGWVKPVLPNFEEKKLKEGGKGGNVGDMGAILCYRDKNKLFDSTLSRMADVLRPLSVSGIIDLNCIINGAGVWGIEWTAFRWGTPTILLQDEVMKEDWGEFLYKLALGTTKRIKVSKNWAVGVSLVTMPFPIEIRGSQGKEFGNMLIRFPKSTHLHLSDVKKEGKIHLTAGNTGYVCVAAGADADLKRAKIRAYSAIANVKIAGNKGWYRTDIGDRLLNGELDRLEKWGYITKSE